MARMIIFVLLMTLILIIATTFYVLKKNKEEQPLSIQNPSGIVIDSELSVKDNEYIPFNEPDYIPPNID